MTKQYLDELTYEIIGSCIEVHRELGPGLLEKVYHRCLMKEFELQEIQYASERNIQVLYKEISLDTKLRCDFLIENAIVLEIKAVEKLVPIFEAQLMTYMKLLKAPKGILINFNSKNIFKEGQKTIVNEHFRTLPDR